MAAGDEVKAFLVALIEEYYGCPFRYLRRVEVEHWVGRHCLDDGGRLLPDRLAIMMGVLR